jgi:hypothetical protein
VEYITNVATRRGNNQIPWPVSGRLEFVSRSHLQIIMFPVATFALGAGGGFGYGELIGHEYPENEAGEG